MAIGILVRKYYFSIFISGSALVMARYPLLVAALLASREISAA